MSGTPVALFVYNRLDTTTRVFARIAAARPPVLLVVADGPRADRPGDAERCAEVRSLVTRPDWPCEVRTCFSEVNLGLGRRFSSGLCWAFDEVEEAVILEDDCLPDPTFFGYCDQLLERFRGDPQVMMISGDNYQFGTSRGEHSYFFSHGVGTYGWATWRRAFCHYDFAMRDWPRERERGWLREIWPVPELERYWQARFDETHRGEIDTWDYQWAFAMWRHRGLQVVPDRNLISYIGCLPDAVHTTDPRAAYCGLPTEPMPAALHHPRARARSLGADLYEFHRIFENLPHEVARELERAALARLGS
ncbi:MAG: glycosyltransferase family 2 protein [Vicinamibacteria bacterium]|nr:glycosyltransferase family 2 protein [Vicinamibacteria bacterium]